MDDFWSMIMRGLVQYNPLGGEYYWHNDEPKYIQKKKQGVVFSHEQEPQRKLDMVKIVTLLHRKIAPLGKRSKKIWET